MKKSLLMAASLALLMTLSACPSETPANTPSPEPSAEESMEPTPEETTAPEETPEPEETTAPEPSSDPLPTPPPADDAGFALSSATAQQQNDFSYKFDITGSGFGTAEDYELLQIKSSGNTINLIQNGEPAGLNPDLKAYDIQPELITFTVGSFSPTASDLIQIDYELKGSANSEINSTTIRLSSVKQR